MSAGGDRTVAHATCLGCGCACDDIHLVARAGRIAEARNACTLGVEWFGDGIVPGRASIAGRGVTAEEAIAEAAKMLTAAARPLVYLAPDVSLDAQREAVALADALGAAIDSVTSATALDGLIASQERGRASATLGEVRNRADLLVFWGVDPSRRYPRFTSRYAPDPAGLFVDGRRSRTVVAVDIADVEGARGPADADRRIAVAASEEVAMLTALAAVASGAAGANRAGAAWSRAGEIAPALVAARYVVIVADGERADGDDRRDRGRAAALIALAQALNGPTRCALCTLRGGGNRSGADAVLTWQTGYPAAVDYSRGHPRYRPHDGTAHARLMRGDVDAAAIIGAPAGIPSDLLARLAGVPAAAIGPRVSDSALASRGIVIDTGIAGIHEAGTAVRMDDVPVALHAVLDGARSAAATVRTLREAVRR